MNRDSELNARNLRRFIAKSKARLKELEQLKLANPNVPNFAIEMERKHLEQCEAQVVALNN